MTTEEKYYKLKKEVIYFVEDMLNKTNDALDTGEDCWSTLEYISDKSNELLDKI